MSSSAWLEKVHKDIAGDWHTVSRFNYLGELEGTAVKAVLTRGNNPYIIKT